MIFLIIVSATVIGLSSWAQGDLNSTRAFVGAQNFQSAANSATQVAVQYVRYNFLDESLYASPPTLCWASNGPVSLTFGPETVDSWCSTANPTGYRIVTISTCLSSSTAAACELAPLLQAIIKINDTDASGNITCSPVPVGQNPSAGMSPTCGQGLTIESWAFGASPPEVSGVTHAGTCPGAATALITGTGFGNVAAVVAVPASSAGRMGDLKFPVASFTVTGTTHISAVLNPQMPSGQYDIRVSTSAGNNALVSASGFSC